MNPKTLSGKAGRTFAGAPGSALACRIADVLMTNGHGEKARRLQLRGDDEKDIGGYGLKAVVRLIDKELDADERFATL